MAVPYVCPYCKYEGTKTKGRGDSERFWCDKCLQGFRRPKKPKPKIDPMWPRPGQRPVVRQVRDETRPRQVGVERPPGEESPVLVFFMAGVLILILIIGMSFTGQNLREADQRRANEVAAREAKREDFRTRVHDRTMEDARYQYQHGNQEEAEKLLNGLR